MRRSLKDLDSDVVEAFSGFDYELTLKLLSDACTADAIAVRLIARGHNYNRPKSMFSTAMRSDVHRGMSADVTLLDRLVQDEQVESSAVLRVALRRAAEFGVCISGETYRRVQHETSPSPFETAVLLDESLLRAPWEEWDLTGRRDAKHFLVERGVALFPRTSGSARVALAHSLIHALELTPQWDIAAPYAEALRTRSLSNGHLRHMPAHIALLRGDYGQVVSDCLAACRLNAVRLASGLPFAQFGQYIAHDLHTVVVAACNLGSPGLSLSAAEALESAMMFMEGKLEGAESERLVMFRSIRAQVLLRFGRWRSARAALASFQMDSADSVAKTLYCYVETVALANMGLVDEARRALDSLYESLSQVAPERLFFNNRYVDILTVMAHVAEAEVRFHDGALEAAWEGFERAIRCELTIRFDEPWPLLLPPRQAYAALLAESGAIDEARLLALGDLGIEPTSANVSHPCNAWSMGLLREIGVSPVYQRRFDEMWLRASSETRLLRSSCSCSASFRLSPEGPEGDDVSVSRIDALTRLANWFDDERMKEIS